MATVQQLILSYKLKLDKTDSSAYPDMLEPEIKYWLDEAANRFVKQRYERTNTKRKGFEESQKRIDDLRLAVKTENVIAALSNPNPNNIFSLSLPEDYRYLVKIKLNVTYNDCNLEEITDIITKLKQVEQDDIHVLLEDPFNRPDLSRPLFIMEGNEIIVYTDGTFTVNSADITYINLFYRLQPGAVNFDGTTDHYSNGDVYDALADDTHDEIVDIAVKLTLENIESQRYQTNAVEIREQE